MSNDDFANQFLDKGKELYEQGDKHELLRCLDWCLTNRVPIPDWLAQAFRDACHAATMHKIKSWDEVFGKPLKKGKRLARERRNMEIAQKLYERVQERREAKKAIDFAAIGKDLGISGSTARDLYYEIMREFISSDE